MSQETVVRLVIAHALRHKWVGAWTGTVLDTTDGYLPCRHLPRFGDHPIKIRLP